MNYPDLTKETMICLDTETYDPNLRSKGTGVYRDDGYILGVSIATPSGINEYYNLGHKEGTHAEKQENYSYLKKMLKHDNSKLGANIAYDLDWLCNSPKYRMNIGGKYHDILIAEPILDENSGHYSLDALAMKYLEVHKEKSECEKWCETRNLKGDFRQHLYLMPLELVKQYALADTTLPLQIFKKQVELLRVEELLGIYELEIGLIPLLLQMRKVGIRIDSEKVYANKGILEKKLELLKNEFNKNYGKINFNSTQQVARAFDKYGIPYKRNKPTDKMLEKGISLGNPSIDQKYMASIEDKYPLCVDIVAIKKLSRTISAVFNNVLIDCNTKGRVHTQLAQLRTDDNGTITGRLSSYSPNLQQIPGKKENYGKECRECIIPEVGYGYAVLDASQIEYRLFAHYAMGDSGEMIRQQYNTNPDTDYHQFIMDLSGLERKPAKNLNFGSMYGMGVKKCAETFGWTMEEAKKFLAMYHEAVPALKQTMQNVITVARGRGYIRTILGRRSRVNADIIKFDKYYIMFNKVIQGSAADHMKKAMLDAYKEGLFNILVLHLTIHDELDVSFPKTKEGIDTLFKLKFCMENSVKLKVPILAKLEVGENWGNLTKVNTKEELYTMYNIKE